MESGDHSKGINMPLGKEGKPPFCINHPDKAMILLKSKKNQSPLHALLMVQEADSPTTYKMDGEATGVNVYTCQLCGYCEIYLSRNELEQRSDLD
jgi:NAD-dependent dihydropyrimidine dehydrogenase PreA subunit